MYFGRRHSATVTLTDTLTYLCKRCEYTAEAEVKASGTGSGTSPFMLDEDGASQRAYERAEREARENLVETLELARCPRCGKRDDRVMRLVMLRGLVYSVGVAALVIAVFWVIDQSNRDPIGLGVSVPVALVTGTVIYLASRHRRLTADQRVRFTGEPPKRIKPPRVRPPAPSPSTRPRPDASDPYRAAPSSAIEVVHTAKPLAPAPIVAGSTDDKKPSFLV